MKSEVKKGFFYSIFELCRNYVKKNYPLLILTGITFLAACAMSFVKIATTATVASFNIEDYEIGQIADVTIRATKTLPPDYENPVSVEKDEKIIRKGFPITEEGYAKLMKMASSPVYIDYRAFANTVIFHIMLCAMFFFLLNRVYFGHELLFKELVTECVFYLIVVGLAMFGGKFPFFSQNLALPVIIPSSLFIFLVSILFGQLNSVFFSIIISLGVLNASSFQITTFLYVLATSLCATRIVRNIERRVDMVFASLLLAILNAVFAVVFKIVFNDSFSESLGVLFALAFNGFISGILCLGLLTPLEMLLNTASPFRLMDLSDLNNSTMKKMLLNASGTYNHSMMVASLAEAACNEIGANALLARVGAYYHDIGKIETPEYFVENQQGGENVHNTINPSLSVSIIRSHVKRGVEKARSLHFPKQIIDIISEHHGNSVISFFYKEAKELNPDVNPEDYAYSGNPPSSKESAIVMLADTVEAACRTLVNPSVPRLDKFIDGLIKGKEEAHQLENCNLTFNELTKIHDSFLQLLAGHYHSRIEYPDQKDPDKIEKDESRVEKTIEFDKTVDRKNENSENNEKSEKLDKSVEKNSEKTEKTIERKKEKQKKNG